MHCMVTMKNHDLHKHVSYCQRFVSYNLNILFVLLSHVGCRFTLVINGISLIYQWCSIIEC
jgi:hypothetical protein